MVEIKIVPETACLMYFDNNGNFVDSFFINDYFFNQLTQEQLNALKMRLEMDHVIPIKIFYNLITENLFLVCKNKKLLDKNDKNAVFTFVIKQNGEQTGKGYDYIKYIENDSNFVELHNFSCVLN